MLLFAVVPHVQSARAQTRTVEAGRGDINGFGGLYRGEGLNAATVGGGAGYTAHRNLRVFGEAFYFRKNLTDIIGAPRGVDVTASAIAFDGGVQILLPIGESPAVPFLTVGGGFARVSASARMSGQQFSVSGSETVSTFMLGGGLDYYVSDKWGIRPEFRVFRGPEYRATVGIFYRF
jgi:opacity protein-like surface antigen